MTNALGVGDEIASLAPRGGWNAPRVRQFKMAIPQVIRYP